MPDADATRLSAATSGCDGMSTPMSERGNGKIIAIVAVFLAAIGGAAYWFFGIRAKNVQRDAAQAEIVAWETRLAAARECLFGPKPASSDSGEAFAVRELTPDVWDRSTCTKLVGALARGVADDTGILPVEHAWMTLNRAAAKTATAFAVSKDPYGKTAADERRGVSDLPDALRELDKAHAELRQAATMPPPPTVAIAPLPAAQIVPLLLDGAEITNVDMFPRPSAGALVTWGVTKDSAVQITLVPGATPILERVPALTMRGLAPARGSSWGAAELGGSIVVGAIDDKGAFTTPQTISPTRGALLAAVGPFDDSLVAFVSADDLVFAHGKGSPPSFTLDKPIRFVVSQSALDPIAGRTLIVWSEMVEPARNNPETLNMASLVGTIVQDGSPIQTIALGFGDPHSGCLSRRHAYVHTSNREIVRFDATGAMPLPVGENFTLWGCGAGGALLMEGGTTRFSVCDDAGCRLVDLRGARPSKIATLAGDHVISVAVRERVLAVWSEKAAPVFYRLPEKVVPRKVISDGKTIDVLGESGTEGKPLHYVLVRVPAT